MSPAWRIRLVVADSLLCRAMPSLARYTIDAHLESGNVYHMDSVSLRSARNAAVLALSFRAHAEDVLDDPDAVPQYRVRALG